MSNKLKFAEYIWLDGNVPVRQIRSKARVIEIKSANPSINDFPEWSFDGSSTEQAEGGDSDCILKPVYFVKDPFRGVENGYLVMCEVYSPDGKTVHESNSRAQLRKILDKGGKKLDAWAGFEQEYTIFKGNAPLGWPEEGYPAPQGPYYCGVGSRQIFGRELAEEHAKLCMEAGLMYYGINAEVMPGQWEFQIGYRGVEGEDAPAIDMCDQMWIARWMIHKVSEKYRLHISLENKPVKGDWNGTGMHTNFSTKETRDKKSGLKNIEQIVKKLAPYHSKHIALYGHKNEERLTGKHETSSIEKFSSATASRATSVRIPRSVELRGYGYFEDRRPGANADPYLVAARLLASIADLDKEMEFNSWPR